MDKITIITSKNRGKFPIKVKDRIPRKKKKNAIIRCYDDGSKCIVGTMRKPYRKITLSEKIRIENAYKKQYGI